VGNVPDGTTCCGQIAAGHCGAPFNGTCSAGTCSNINSCGNGVVELALGESCDDGNTVTGDGCDATCHVETSTLRVGCYTLVNNPPFIASVDVFYAGPIDVAGNTTDFFDSTDGTCSGGAIPDHRDGIIAAANMAAAQSKCDALAGAGAFVLDLGAPTGFRPSAPGLWFCAAPPN
jgi:cysteine-rich repeat protein